MAFGVGVEKMIRAGIVLVDALLDETHPEDAGVEIEILLSRTGDGSNVMESGESGCIDSQNTAKPLIARAENRRTFSLDRLNIVYDIITISTIHPMSEPTPIDNTQSRDYPVRLQRLVHARLEPRLFFGGLALLVRELQRSGGELGFNWLIVLGIALPILAVILLGGLFTLQPNEARVLILFGAYHGTVRSSGFSWANPFYSRSRGGGGAVADLAKRRGLSAADRVANTEHQDFVARPEF